VGDVTHVDRSARRSRPWLWALFVGLLGFDVGSWGAMEHETGVSQRSPSQNSYFLRKKAAYGGMDTCSFAEVPCKSQNLCSNFCKGMAATY
jgi:hypothetical protein